MGYRINRRDFIKRSIFEKKKCLACVLFILPGVKPGR